MRSRRAPALLVLAFACGVAAAEPPVWHLRLANETAVETKDGEVAKFRNLIEPELAWDLSPDLRLAASARLLWDPRFEGWENEAALRELALDWKGEGTAIKAGLQQVVWGQASGFLSSFDVFHPRDLREFVLPPFDFLRRPLWLLRAQRGFGAWTLEALWSPQALMDHAPGPGEPFYVPPPQPAGFVLVDGGQGVDHQRLGLRVSRNFAAWDLAFIYMRVPRNDAVFWRESAGTGVLRQTELHRAFDVVGLSFARASRDTVWRGELSTYRDRDYQTRAAIGGVQQADQLNAVLGVDMTFFTDLEVSVEAGYRRIPQATDEFIEPKARTTWLFQARQPLWHDTVKLGLTVIMNQRDGDSLWRPGLEWAASDRLTLSAGFDLFNGPSTSPFGRFADRDRFYAGAAYRF
jgi:hypothetical protein